MITAGCGLTSTMKDYKATVKSGGAAIPAAAQMEELFPEVDHFITHYGFDNKPKLWNSEAFFGGRYILTMQVMVDVDYTNRKVKQVGEPRFYLQEIQRIEGIYHSYAGDGAEFGLEKWKQLFEAGGELSAIGFTPKRSAVPGFAEMVAAKRRDRIPVSLLSRGTRP
jgi:hypothetical protein